MTAATEFCNKAENSLAKSIDITSLNWEKMNGLIPVIVQDQISGTVLMLGYMNTEALQQTLTTKVVTFYSRSKARLWVKGETSGNKMLCNVIMPDCDNDTLLILATPTGPVCHKGTFDCFGSEVYSNFIEKLEQVIIQRDEQRPQGSYTAELLGSGTARIAQKVGEEGVEVVIAALQGSGLDDSDDDKEGLRVLCNESADLIFHLLILLRHKKLKFADVIEVLRERFG